MQQNNKSWFCGDIDETINHIIRECSKLTAKKSRNDWVRKVIHWESCKNLTPNKWYMHNTEYILENETHKLVWDLGIQRIT